MKKTSYNTAGSEDKPSVMKKNTAKYVRLALLGTGAIGAVVSSILYDSAERKKATEYLNSADLFYTTTRHFTDGQIYNSESSSKIELPKREHVNPIMALINREIEGIPDSEGISNSRLKTAVIEVVQELNGIGIDNNPGGGNAIILPDLNGNGGLEMGRSYPLHIKVNEAREKGIKGNNGFKKTYLDSLRKNKDITKGMK